MKIVCENCSTKYSIADEKVRGKVFKIRCKKCGHIIVVKGTDGASDAPEPAAAGQFGDDKETRVFDYSGFADSMSSQAVWHLVIDGGQVGPLSAEQVKAKYDAGEVDGDTYTWREGFKDWLRLFDVEDFASLANDAEAATEIVSHEQAAAMFSSVADKSAKAEAKQRPTPAPAGGLFGGASESAGQGKGDLCGGLPPEPEPSAPAASGGGMFGDAAPAASSGGGGGLFASPAASSSPAVGKGSLFPDEPEESAPAPAMTGQRNENSVLFSLSNLQSLAGGGGAAPKAAPSKPGYATAKNEGSGLVDIRAMAATTAASRSDASEGFTFSAPSLAAPISAAPVLMPVADSGRPKWLLPAVLGGIGLLLAVVVLLVVVLTKKGPAPASQQARADAMSSTKDGMDAMDTMAADAMDAMDPMANMAADAMDGMAGDTMAADAMDGMAGDTMAADAMDGMAGDAMNGDAMAGSGSRRRRRRGYVTSSRGSSTTRTHTMSAGSSSSSSSGSSSSSSSSSSGGNSLQDLLRRAGGNTGSGSSSSANSNLPKRLSSGKIRAGVSGVMGSARACNYRYKVPGTCRVRVVISGSTGRVSSVSILGSFAGTPTGRCVARAFRRARFSKFQNSSQSFIFPLIFR